MPSVIWFVDVKFLPRTVLPFYMCFCQTNTDWISEHHLLIFLVVQLFSHRFGYISAHWYTCGIYPSTHHINFTQVVAKCLRNWIQRLGMTFIKVNFFIVLFSEKNGSRKANIFKSSFRIIILLMPTRSVPPKPLVFFFPFYLHWNLSFLCLITQMSVITTAYRNPLLFVQNSYKMFLFMHIW